jgi:hypothetical protein
MFTSYIFMLSFTESIHFFLRRPLLGCPRNFGKIIKSNVIRTYTRVCSLWKKTKRSVIKNFNAEYISCNNLEATLKGGNKTSTAYGKKFSLRVNAMPIH